jgi:hypothetical protein
MTRWFTALKWQIVRGFNKYMPAILFGMGVASITLAMYLRTELNDKVGMSVAILTGVVFWIIAIAYQAHEDGITNKKYDALIDEVKGLRKDLTNKGEDENGSRNSDSSKDNL